MIERPSTISARPLFQQIKRAITERVEAGEWQVGEPLPSETEFARVYEVSQGTVRSAITQMAAENVVVRRRGKGTFVTSHTEERVHSRFFHLHRDSGDKALPSSRQLSCRRRKASRDMCQRLELQPKADVIVVERIRLVDDAPLALEVIVVSEAVFPELCSSLTEALPNELYPHYESRFGIHVARAVERLRAVAAGPHEADHLGVDEGTPLLEVDRQALTYSGRPVEWRRSLCRTSHHHYLSVLA